MADFVDELFYGGAAGGGKSDFLLGDFLQDVPTYGRAWQGVLFRRTYNELEELIRRAREIYPPSGGVWHEQAKSWTWPNGALLRMRYIERDHDATRYQGHQYTWVGFDELTQWPSDYGYRFLRARLRSAHNVPNKRIRAAANPGGVGHHWVKAYFVDPAPGGYEVIEDPVTKVKRMFVPAKLRDNKILLNADPTYAARLKGLSSDAMVRAWLEGDWTVIEGAFFDCWRYDLHVVPPFVVPSDWTRFRSMDWGSAKPFSIGWWAIVPDDYVLGAAEGRHGLAARGSESPPGAPFSRAPQSHTLTLCDETRVLPRGALVRYREWYGCTSAPNTGLKLTAEAVASGLVEREKGETMRYGVLDPACFREDGGPSIAERMNKVLLAHRARPFHAADNARVPQRGSMGGWDQMRSRLVGRDGVPMLYFFSTCAASIRTIPALQHDPARMEDVDCWVAGTMIATAEGDKPIEDVMVGDFVDTPIGWRPVLKSYLSGATSTVWIRLSDGRRLEGTARHKVYVEGKGLISLDKLECHDILIERSMSWQKRLLFIGALLTHDTKVAVTTIRTGRFWRTAARAFIDRFGWTPGEKYQLAGTSITSMGTTITTNWPTLSVYPREPTPVITTKTEKTYKRSWPFGETVEQAEKLCGKTPTRCWSELQSVNLRADIVGVLLGLDTLISHIARPVALMRRVLGRLEKAVRCVGLSSGQDGTRPKKSERARIVAVGRSDDAAKVYNLTVAEAHLFFANGLLSSNTESEDHAADCTRYACMSRPFSPVSTPKRPKLDTGYVSKGTRAPGDWLVY